MARELTEGASLTGAEPQLFVAEIETSVEFFTGKLGFAVAFLYGEPPFYGQVVRGAAKLNLRKVCAPVFVGDIRAREDLLAAAVTVEGIEPLFGEFQATGAPFHQTLRQEPWGARTFIVKDPDGNLILFAE